MMKKTLLGLTALGMAAGLSACQTPGQDLVIASSKSPVELRAMQVRAFDTPDRTKVMRSVIATFQDLGYTVDKVEAPAGTVSATKFSQLRMTATVVPRGAAQMTVRANAVMELPGKKAQVDDPAFYQQLFFEPLSKAMFLAAQTVDDKDTAELAKPADKTASQ